MPAYINPNRPGTLQDLQRIYTSNPNVSPEEVDSRLHLNAPQGREWTRQTANAVGIGNDPAAYFSQMQTRQRMANYAGAQQQQPQYASEFARNQAIAQAEPIAPLQSNFQRYPLQQQLPQMTVEEQQMDLMRPKTVASAPAMQLSPFLQQQARQDNMTNEAMYLRSRLGEQNRFFQDASGAKRDWINPTAKSKYTPEQFYTIPEFQTAYKRDPQKAAHVFEALTGTPLAGYEQQRAASMKQQGQDQEQYGRAFFDMVKEGKVRLSPEGQFLTQAFTWDAINNKEVPTGEWAPASGLTKQMIDLGQKSHPQLLEFLRLQNKRGKTETQTQGTTITPDFSDPISQAASPNQWQGIGFNPEGGRTRLGDVGTAIGSTLAGVQNLFGGNVPEFESPKQNTLYKIPRELINNPRFTALPKEKQERLIQAIRLGSGRGGGL